MLPRKRWGALLAAPLCLLFGARPVPSCPQGVQGGCPPTWLVAGFAGCFNEPRHGGKMGFWDGGKTPALAHFVGAPDKPQNMKYVGVWHYKADALAEWSAAARDEITREWGDEEDAAAAADPLEAGVATRLREEGARVRAAVGALAQFEERCDSPPVVVCTLHEPTAPVNTFVAVVCVAAQTRLPARGSRTFVAMG